mmetsp:Transcript_31301/g.79839  ORF Transcript_31301/g.79839 Transcript_31301/m.79839 type:complete len:253 (-) Transcript_31301:869-1627(-)
MRYRTQQHSLRTTAYYSCNTNSALSQRVIQEAGDEVQATLGAGLWHHVPRALDRGKHEAGAEARGEARHLAVHRPGLVGLLLPQAQAVHPVARAGEGHHKVVVPAVHQRAQASLHQLRVQRGHGHGPGAVVQLVGAGLPVELRRGGHVQRGAHLLAVHPRQRHPAVSTWHHVPHQAVPAAHRLAHRRQHTAQRPLQRVRQLGQRSAHNGPGCAAAAFTCVACAGLLLHSCLGGAGRGCGASRPARRAHADMR